MLVKFFLYIFFREYVTSNDFKKLAVATGGNFDISYYQGE